MGDFEKAVVATVDESGQWTAAVAPGWDVIGHPHGGYLLAIAARIALGATGREHPLSVTAHFLRSPVEAPVTATPRVLRAGRSTAVVAVDLCQDGQPVLATLTTAGHAPGGGSPVFQRGDAPTMPAPDACVDARGPHNPFPQNLHGKIDIRLDPATAGWTTGSPGRSGEYRGWVRPRDDEAPGALFLLVALDALPPLDVRLRAARLGADRGADRAAARHTRARLAPRRHAQQADRRRLARRGRRGVGLRRPPRRPGPPTRRLPRPQALSQSRP
jgi:hypothetical protein